MSATLEDRIYTVFARVFLFLPEHLCNQTRRGDFDDWDSLGHIQLIAELKEEFDIEIEVEDAIEIETVQDVKQVVAKILEKKQDPCDEF